jgi:hypothetical protein
MSVAKRMLRIPPVGEGAGWAGPVLVRGWLRLRHPWLHPLATLQLALKWRRVRKDLDRAAGFVSFEYWQRLETLVLGMHVGWRTYADSQGFADVPSHVDIARWATASRLVCAMQLETLALTGDGHLLRLGGFYICEREADIPPDALFPVSGSG